ncbi:hypothetical protein MML48_1g01254 [Holotrichia oblita]|uniref:Uncharacterized protein n=1 Tax=Holotrichia oblita TaxID=644536 RepID=A0ACB9TSV0_HOLOL|nr:hypothetical protein MML48_1g01254 [Holotrichia oblita]
MILLSIAPKAADYTVAVCGDFNLNFLSTKDRRIEDFRNLLLSFDLKETILEPTRICGSSSTLIDNIFVKSVLNFKECINKNALSDHFGQEVSFEILLATKCISNNTYRTLLGNQEIAEIRERLAKINWMSIQEPQNPNKSTYRFITIIVNIYKEVCSEKLIIKKTNTQTPWTNDNIKNQCRIKLQLYEPMIKEKISKVFYNNYSKRLQTIIKTQKKECNSRYILQAKNKIQATWNLVNNITGKKRKYGFDIVNLTKSNMDKKQTLNDLNNFYINLGSNNRNGENNTANVEIDNKSMVLATLITSFQIKFDKLVNENKKLSRQVAELKETIHIHKSHSKSNKNTSDDSVQQNKSGREPQSIPLGESSRSETLQDLPWKLQ